MNVYLIQNSKKRNDKRFSTMREVVMNTAYRSRNTAPVLLLLVVVSAILYALINIPLPGLHDLPIPRINHHVGTRLRHELQGKEIINNVKNPCRHYECSSSPGKLLRVCTEELVAALQWMWNDSKSWYEGTTFIQRKANKVSNYLRNNECKEIINVSN